MRCLNCQAPLGLGGSRAYEGVLVCGTCHTIARQFESRIDRELDALRVLSRDAIRVALMEGKIHLSPAPAPPQEVDVTRAREERAAVLRAMIEKIAPTPPTEGDPS